MKMIRRGSFISHMNSSRTQDCATAIDEVTIICLHSDNCRT